MEKQKMEDLMDGLITNIVEPYYPEIISKVSSFPQKEWQVIFTFLYVHRGVYLDEEAFIKRLKDQVIYFFPENILHEDIKTMGEYFADFCRQNFGFLEDFKKEALPMWLQKEEKLHPAIYSMNLEVRSNLPSTAEYVNSIRPS